MEEFEKLKNDISLHSVWISSIRRANLCMQDNIFNNTCNSVLYCSIAIERNKKLIISSNTLHCFNHTMNNVCKHYLGRRQSRQKNGQLNRSQRRTLKSIFSKIEPQIEKCYNFFLFFDVESPLAPILSCRTMLCATAGENFSCE